MSSYMTLIPHQISLNLTLILHSANEFMRFSRLYARKNFKKFVTLTWHTRVMDVWICAGCSMCWRGLRGDEAQAKEDVMKICKEKARKD